MSKASDEARSHLFEDVNESSDKAGSPVVDEARSHLFEDVDVRSPVVGEEDEEDFEIFTQRPTVREEVDVSDEDSDESEESEEESGAEDEGEDEGDGDVAKVGEDSLGQCHDAGSFPIKSARRRKSRKRKKKRGSRRRCGSCRSCGSKRKKRSYSPGNILVYI
jgi:hypothetical protein